MAKKGKGRNRGPARMHGPIANKEYRTAVTKSLLGRLSPDHANEPEHITYMRPEMQTRLSAFMDAGDAALGGKFGIMSGRRSTKRQAELRARFDAARKAGKHPALVGKAFLSQHVHGFAADVTYNGKRLDKAPKRVRDWAYANLANFGLTQPVPGEFWHLEPIDRPMNLPNVPAIAPEAVADTGLGGVTGAEAAVNVPTPTPRPDIGGLNPPGLRAQPAVARPATTPLGGLHQASIRPDRVVGGLMGTGPRQASIGPNKVDVAQNGLIGSSSIGAMPGMEDAGSFSPFGRTLANPTRGVFSREPGAVGGLMASRDPNKVSGGLMREGALQSSIRPDKVGARQQEHILGKSIGPMPGQENYSSFDPNMADIEPKANLPYKAEAPTLADRSALEQATSELPSTGPQLGVRPSAAQTVAQAQPAAPDEVDTSVPELGAPKEVGTHAIADVAPADDAVGYPEAPPEPEAYGPFGPYSRVRDVAQGVLKGGLFGGLPGAAIGALGGLMSGRLGPTFDAAAPDRYSTGSGLQGISAALGGSKGATGTSLSNPGMSVTSLGPATGNSLRRSEKYGWTEVVGPDGSVRGIQYDKPQEKGLLGKISSWAGSKFGGRSGISPAASKAISKGTSYTKGGLY